MREKQIWSLGWEDSLEKEMATHSSIQAWRIPWTEEPDRLYSPRGHKESDKTEWLSLSLFIQSYQLGHHLSPQTERSSALPPVLLNYFFALKEIIHNNKSKFRKIIFTSCFPSTHGYYFILFFTNVNLHSLFPRVGGGKLSLSLLKCSKGKFLSDFKC